LFHTAELLHPQCSVFGSVLAWGWALPKREKYASAPWVWLRRFDVSEIDAGTCTLPAFQISVVCTFGFEFSSPPTVVETAANPNGARGDRWVASTTTSGFSILTGFHPTQDAVYSWVAVGD
jgi:hypothetical protein